jgi:hypothetical protein
VPATAAAPFDSARPFGEAGASRRTKPRLTNSSMISRALSSGVWLTVSRVISGCNGGS